MTRRGHPSSEDAESTLGLDLDLLGVPWWILAICDSRTEVIHLCADRSRTQFLKDASGSWWAARRDASKEPWFGWRLYTGKRRLQQSVPGVMTLPPGLRRLGHRELKVLRSALSSQSVQAPRGGESGTDRHRPTSEAIISGLRSRWPILGVGGLVFDRGRVLLVKRGVPPAQGLWSIPGGKLRRGESLAQAVERELSEETGQRVRAGELVAVYERLPRADEGDRGRHYVVLDFLCESNGGSLRAGDDAADVGWFRVNELDGLSLTQGAAEVIRKGHALSAS